MHKFCFLNEKMKILSQITRDTKECQRNKIGAVNGISKVYLQCGNIALSPNTVKPHLSGHFVSPPATTPCA